MPVMTVGACPCGETGTLIDGLCAFCETARALLRPASRPLPTPATSINAVLIAFLAELVAGDVPDPLAQPFTLGAIWADLCRLAGETPPPMLAVLLPQGDVRAGADEPPSHPESEVRRGSYADHRLEFPEAYADGGR